MNIYEIRKTATGPAMGYVKARNKDDARVILQAATDRSSMWNRLHTEDGEARYGLHFVTAVPEGYDQRPGIVD